MNSSRHCEISILVLFTEYVFGARQGHDY